MTMMVRNSARDSTHSRNERSVEPRSRHGISSESNGTIELMAELNNEGASHLENRLFNESIAAFLAALTAALKIIPTSTACYSNQNGNYDGNPPNHAASPPIDTHKKEEEILQASLHRILPELKTPSSSTPSALGEGSLLPNVVDTFAEISPVAAKPKKTKRRKHRRRNSLGSVSSKGSTATHSSSSHRPSRRERRRNRVRRARSEMGRRTGKSETRDELDEAAVVSTEDVQRQPARKFVYNKPLRVLDRYNLPTWNELMIYTIYNLALAFHLQTLSMLRQSDTMVSSTIFDASSQSNESSSLTNSNQPNWNRIIELYQLVSDLIDKQQQYFDDNEDAVVDPNSPLWSPTYTVAIPNNLACVYHISGGGSSSSKSERQQKEAAANAIWEQILSQMWCILDVGCMAEVECFSDILDNASHLLDPTSSTKSPPAPAA